MEDRNLSDLGKMMSDAVQEAIRTGNFTRLKSTVNATLHTVVDKTVSYGSGAQAGERRTRQQHPYYSNSPGGDRPLSSNQGDPPRVRDQGRPAAPKNAAGTLTGIAMAAVGLCGSIPLGIAAMAVGIAAVVDGSIFTQFMIAEAVLLPLFCLALVLTVKGFCTYGRAKRYKRYWRLLEDRQYCEVEKLAAAVGKQPQFVVKELQKMLEAGMFPEGHMDQQQSCLMLGEQVYRQYLEAQESMRKRQQREEQIKKDPDGIAAVIEEGRSCIQKIREANDALPGEEISQKLNRLELVAAKIFSYVEQRPKKLPEIRRFMNYYLPTTMKLVDSYRDFEAQPVQGENIVKAKSEILEILDTINSAFETLLDSLYADDALDISTDISVLKTMLAREGLTQKDFEKEEKK